jgi:hypothetical protein
MLATVTLDEENSRLRAENAELCALVAQLLITPWITARTAPTPCARRAWAYSRGQVLAWQTYPLREASVDYTCQVIELSPPSPANRMEHRVIARWCLACRCWDHPQCDLRVQVLGQGCIGVRSA